MRSHFEMLDEKQAKFCRHLIEAWPSLTEEEKHTQLHSMERHILEDVFLHVSAQDKVDILAHAKQYQRWSLAHLLAPDDLVDVLQKASKEIKAELLGHIEGSIKAEVLALMAYKEDQAGGRMNSRYAQLRPEMTAQEAIVYLRALTLDQAESIYQAYVVDQNQVLLGVVSLRQLFRANPTAKLNEFMTSGEHLVRVPEDMDQEEIVKLFKKKSYSALPVVDKTGKILGIVTIDDFVKVVQEEATEDIQKLGGMEALDAPYFATSFFHLVRKRAGWLLALFIGEMFTATAMGYFEGEIQKAVVLALFIPLIISSGGNSGSQASTLIIRAMALGEIRIRDWWKVLGRELAAGLALGGILGIVGMCRILLWPSRASLYGEHYALIAVTVGLSLIGIVMWGALSGSMLPFVLRKLRFDPATASAPFVATLVDVTGLIIYFTVASIVLKGILL